MDLLQSKEFDFPVVGTGYKEGAYEIASTLSVGSVLGLVPEPDNPYDVFAIKVCFKGACLGYVPNKGFSCAKCWSAIDPKFYTCKTCGGGGDNFVKGGLATRISQKGLLELPHGCYVSAVNVQSKTTPLMAKIATAIEIN